MRAFLLGLSAVLLAVLTAALWYWLGQAPGVVRAGDGAANESAHPMDGAIDGQSAANAAGANAALLRTALAPSEPEAKKSTPAWHPGDEPKVRGRIVDVEGHGIPGAAVLAASGEFWIQVPLDVEPEGIPKGWFEVRRTTTDAEGRFAFDDLKPGTLRVAARAPGYAPAHEDHLTLPDRPEHELQDIRLVRGVVLAGRVVDREAKGVAGATLLQPLECGRDSGGNEVKFPSRGVPLATTGEDGSFTIDELASGPWSLIVDAPGFAVSEESGRTRSAGDRVGELLFRVDRGFEILGHVRAEDGPLPETLRVSARPSPEEEERNAEDEEPELPSPVSQRVRHAICASDGSFTVRGLQASTRYALSLWRGDESGANWKLARGTATAHGYAGQRGIEIVYKAEAALVFRVTDARSGLPLTELGVWAGVANERVLCDDEDKPLRLFPDGRVRYGGLRPKRGGKPLRLRVAATGYADHERKDLVLDPGQTLDLGEIQLAPEHVVLARVVDDRTGDPVEGARVVLGTQTAKELRRFLTDRPGTDLHDLPQVRFGRADARGCARLSSLPGKSTTAVADAKGYLASEPVSSFLPEGEDREIALRLRRGGTVVVTVHDHAGRPVEGIGIEKKDPARAEENGGFEAAGADDRTDGQGLSRFEALEPGVYSFRVSDQPVQSNTWYPRNRERDGEGWVEVVATDGATATLEFTVESRGGLLGRVREGGLPLAGARLHLVDPERAEGSHPDFGGGENDPLSTMTDAEGAYRFEKVKSGSYTLEVAHGSRRMVARFPVRVEDPPRVFDVDLDVAVIEGRVVGQDGQALEGIEVQCLNAEGRSESEGSWRVLLTENEQGEADVDYRQDVPGTEKTDANGHYSLRGVRSGDPVQVAASGDQVQPETKPAIVLGPDEIRRNVDFVLADAGAIEIVMTGNPASGRGGWFLVRASQIVGDGQEGASASSHFGTWNRTTRLRSLAPGRYRVQIFRGGRQSGQSQLDVEIDVVVRETARVTFQAP